MTTIAQSGGKEQSKQAFTGFSGLNLRMADWLKHIVTVQPAPFVKPHCVLPVHCMAELLKKLRNSVLQFERHYDKITYVVIKERWSAAAADTGGAS